MNLCKFTNKVVKITLNTAMVTTAVVASTSALSVGVCILAGFAIVEGTCYVANKLCTLEEA